MRKVTSYTLTGTGKLQAIPLRAQASHKRDNKGSNDNVSMTRYRFKRYRVILGVAGLFLACFINSGGKAYGKGKPKAEIKKVETKEIIGEIISFSPMKNPKFIGVAYQAGDVGYDAFFKVDEHVKVVHKRSLDGMKLGDMVSVTYNEITQVTEEGKEQTVRVAKMIRFVKPATRKIRHEVENIGAKKSSDLGIKGYKSSE